MGPPWRCPFEVNCQINKVNYTEEQVEETEIRRVDPTRTEGEIKGLRPVRKRRGPVRGRGEQEET